MLSPITSGFQRHYLPQTTEADGTIPSLIPSGVISLAHNIHPTIFPSAGKTELFPGRPWPEQNTTRTLYIPQI